MYKLLVRKIFSVILLQILVIFSSSHVRAAQLLEPLGLYSIENDTNHLLFLGKGERGIYVFEIQNGKALQLELEGRSMTYHDGGTMDLYLKNGWRVVVPTQQQKKNYINFPFGPSLVYPDKPRDDLYSIEISQSVLAAKGVASLVDPDFFNPKPEALKSKQDDPIFLKDPASADLILISAASGRMQSKSRDAIQKIVGTYPETAYLNESSLYHRSIVIIADQTIRQEIISFSCRQTKGSRGASRSLSRGQSCIHNDI